MSTLEKKEIERRRRRSLWAVTICIVLAVVASGLYWWVDVRQWAQTNDAYVTGNITPIQAQTEGSVTDVLVDNTQYVTEGQVLVRMQGDRAQLAMQKAQAHLGTVTRQVKRLMHKLQEDQGQLDTLQSREEKVKHDLDRYRQAAPDQAVSAIKVQNTTDQLAVLHHQIVAAQARLASDAALVKADTVEQNPLVHQAAAEYLQAWLNWRRLNVRAPISGFVAQREVYPGMVLSRGAHLLDIVPLDDIWVVANIKETDMARVRPGQKVQLTTYYYGDGIRYDGLVQGLEAGAGSAFSILPPENATGNYIHIVERVPVRISIDAAELERHPLRPGLSMVARIDLESNGQKINAPLVITPKRSYRTRIYAHQLELGRQLATRIIQENL